MADEEEDHDEATPADTRNALAPPLASDEDPVEETLFKFELREIEGVELKPINAAYADLLSTDPDKTAKRDKAAKDYAEALKANGELTKLYELVDRKFVEIAGDIVRSPAGDALLDDWIANHLGAGGAVHELIARQSALANRLADLRKFRFANVLAAKADADQAGKDYTEWLGPVAAIKARIDGYKADLDKINAALDAGEKPAWPIYQFWFVVAPKHLQLRPKTVSDGNAPGYSKVVAALTGEIASRADALKSGKDREGAPLHLVAPDAYLAARGRSLEYWSDKLEAYAKALAENKFRPDEPGKLIQRLKELGDSEAASVKAQLDK